MRVHGLLAVGLMLVGCGRPPASLEPIGGGGIEEPIPVAPVAPITTLSPAPAPFNDKLTVKLSTDREATVFLTLDGSDPQLASAERIERAAPFTVELTKTTTLRYFAKTAEGGLEPPRSGEYVRAGGPKGTVRGVVQVGAAAVGLSLALSVDGQLTALPKATAPGPVPFFVEKVGDGTHRLVAVADRDGDGNFLPLLDLLSDPVLVAIELKDPFKAAVENVVIFLGASAPEKGTIHGTVTIPDPPLGQALTVAAVSPSQLTAGADPSKLLELLQSGDRMLTRADQTKYPYAITDLAPGRYTTMPILGGLGTSGASLNLLVNPLRTVEVKAGGDATMDHAFGPVHLSGTLTLKANAQSPFFTYAIVVAKSFSLTGGAQALFMPVLILHTPGATTQRGTYGGGALRANQTFQLRVFTSEASANPIADALVWALTPFGGAPPHGSVSTASNDVIYDLTLP